jgi:hypothetical protein
MTCVLLGERHHSLSDGVRGLLKTTFSAVFMVADLASLAEGAARIQPMVIVVDLALADGDLPPPLKTLRERAPATKVLLLSVHDDPTVAATAFAAGAADRRRAERRVHESEPGRNATAHSRRSEGGCDARCASPFGKRLIAIGVPHERIERGSNEERRHGTRASGETMG